MKWKPVGFERFEDVPLHYRPLKEYDPEIVKIVNCYNRAVFHKPSTDQWWIQIGFVDGPQGGRCPTERCGAQCCKEGSPWPSKFPNSGPGCMFLSEEKCGIHWSKFLCCITAPEPWNGMENLSKCEIRCVEVRPIG